MRGRRRHTLLGFALSVGLASPLAAQDADGRVIVRGNVVDAVSRAPIESARVIAVDSSAAVLTDPLGGFVIPLPAGAPLSIVAEGFGYAPQRFDLGPQAAERPSLLLLEPAPVEIEGISVVEEAALTTLVRELEDRRRLYPYRVLALDRTSLELYRRASVLDVVRARAPQIVPCRAEPAQMCLPGRSPSLDGSGAESHVGVCVDGIRVPLPRQELEGLSIAAVALLELYLGPADEYTRPHVMIYTGPWMLRQAMAGRTIVRPITTGC